MFQRFLKIVEIITPGFENFDSTGTACFERWKVIKIVCKGDLNSEGRAGKEKKVEVKIFFLGFDSGKQHSVSTMTKH